MQIDIVFQVLPSLTDWNIYWSCIKVMKRSVKKAVKQKRKTSKQYPCKKKYRLLEYWKHFRKNKGGNFGLGHIYWINPYC